MLTRIAALDLATLSEISRLTARMNWPLRDLFGEVERAKAKVVFIEDRPTTKHQRPTTDDRQGDKETRRQVESTTEQSAIYNLLSAISEGHGQRTTGHGQLVV